MLTPSLILSKNHCTTYQTMSLHVKARCEVYPRTQDVKRFIVPDDKVPWSVDFPEYDPIDYTSKSVASQPVWADSPDPATITFNCIDKSCNSDRRSNEGNYQVINGCPRNPRGRTGCKGRGTLGKWGPNHAADPIVTRWQRDSNNEIVKQDGKPVLEFVAVQRRDNGEWALPGGMVDAGENRTATLTREFGEEALNSIDATPERKAQIQKLLTEFFKNGKTIYKGYVDDPRNTDNAWMETKAMNFHDEQGTSVGDDAADVKWMPIHKGLKLYASHIDFIRRTVENHGAYW
ncbi:NUDT9-like protein [Mya arenaria]|uniref:NUDT9-like protein n=1 Tax=Mya arenaria TaxID=6604 RepID=A0ABY7E2D9_MYAAR|nr:NUDT9-like protein [Mya arenaria]